MGGEKEIVEKIMLPFAFRRTALHWSSRARPSRAQRNRQWHRIPNTGSPQTGPGKSEPQTTHHDAQRDTTQHDTTQHNTSTPPRATLSFRVRFRNRVRFRTSFAPREGRHRAKTARGRKGPQAPFPEVGKHRHRASASFVASFSCFCSQNPLCAT